MFALHTPQSITLATPGEDGPFTLINFKTNGADTSRCVMEVVTPEGDVHRLTFTTRGAMVDQQFISKDNPEPEATSELSSEAYFVNGRDTRADNAYTYEAPVDDDRRYRDGLTPGHKSPVPETDEEREHREQVYAEGTKARQKLHDDAMKRREELQKQSGARKPDGDLKTSDDTTAGDIAWDAPEGRQTRRDPPMIQGPDAGAVDHDFPETHGEADPFGRGSTSEPFAPTGGPFAPAPSAPLQGSPPPHPLDRPDHGMVNTTQSMQRGA